MPDPEWPAVGVIGKIAQTRVPSTAAVPIVRPGEVLTDESDVVLTDENDVPLTG